MNDKLPVGSDISPPARQATALNLVKALRHD
jgi:hypothetical protein